jgi:hypothetical protein
MKEQHAILPHPVLVHKAAHVALVHVEQWPHACAIKEVAPNEVEGQPAGPAVEHTETKW